MRPAATISKIIEDLQGIMEIWEQRLDNMSESAQEGARGEILTDKIDSLTEAIEALENIENTS